MVRETHHAVPRAGKRMTPATFPVQHLVKVAGLYNQCSGGECYDNACSRLAAAASSRLGHAHRASGTAAATHDEQDTQDTRGHFCRTVAPFSVPVFLDHSGTPA